MSNSSLLFKKFKKKLGRKAKKIQGCFYQQRYLSSIRIVIGTNIIVLRWYIYIYIYILQSEARVAWISSDCFESFSPHSIDVTEGVITTRSNRMKFRLSKYFSVNQSAAPVYFSQPASADQIWKILINYSIFDCHNPLSLTSFWRRNTRKVEEQPNRLGLEWVQNWRNGDRVQNNVQTK